MKIKVLVADDQELTRDCLKIVLGRRDDMEVIDAVGTGTDVIRSVRAAVDQRRLFFPSSVPCIIAAPCRAFLNILTVPPRSRVAFCHAEPAC